MQNKILISCLFSVIITQNIFSKNDSSIQSLDHPVAEDSIEQNQIISNAQAYEKNKIPTVDELNKKINKLSNQLEKILSQVKNKKDKKILVQLVQKIQTADNAKTETYSSNKTKRAKNSGNRPLRKDVVDLLKRLTTQKAIIAYAAIVCLAITKNILSTGEISKIMHEIQLIVEQVITIEKLRLVGQSLTYIMQGLFYYMSLGYAGKAF
jgi:hypothetical protein